MTAGLGLIPMLGRYKWRCAVKEYTKHRHDDREYEPNHVIGEISFMIPELRSGPVLTNGNE